MGASPQMVDWDEDGDTDLLVGEYDGHVHYFENIGTATNPQLTNNGHLMVGSSQIDVSNLAIPVVQDWNEDGRKDLIVGNDAANIKLYINTGTNANPSFSTTQYVTTTPSISQIKNAPDIGDLNGDGLKDLAFGWWQGTVVYYPNRGTNASPVFNGDYDLTALGTTIDPGGWTHLEIYDWDDDGDLDLVYGEWGGEVYLHLNLTVELQANVTPYGAPIQIPAAGGNFEFNAELVNNSEHDIEADVWFVAKLPDGSETAALAQATLTLPPGSSIDRDRTQMVPDYAPGGDYEYIIRWGQYPDQAWAEGSFAFTKLGDGDGRSDPSGWICDGQAFNGTEELPHPAAFALVEVRPNPFNPSTVLSYTLQDASFTNLSVYDVAGREVARLVDGWQDAGAHQVTFDASHLASGVYVYQLTTGEVSGIGKMLLLK